ncbi:hypothetical protein [Niveibacterium sp. SC-1]|uniref:hypothetical protein n=1 Tax=Niveibacterium sp. SC-1 TaxID=3135646 RepID=UPI00311D9E41
MATPSLVAARRGLYQYGLAVLIHAMRLVPDRVALSFVRRFILRMHAPNHYGSCVELGAAGSFAARWSFAIYLAPTDRPFRFQYQQGNNHWESGVSVVSLEEVAQDRATYDEWLIQSNCAWAIPIFDRGINSMDSSLVVQRLVEGSQAMKRLQDER